MAKQLSFQKTNWRHQYSHGGSLRQKRAGRGARPLSTRESIHLVFKANKDVIRGGFRNHRRFALIHHLLQRYRIKFWIRIEQVSIQGDHIHLLIRTTRRSQYLYFFRVLAGQIAQRFEKEGLLTVPNSKPKPHSGVSVTSSSKRIFSSREALSRKGAVHRNHAVSTTLNKIPTPISSVTDTPKWRTLVEKGTSDESKASLEGATGINAAGFVAVTDTPEGFGSKPGFRKQEKDLKLARVKVIKLWRHRPFTRVVKGWRAYKTVRNYIQLNEKEALGDIPYRSQRLKGLSSSDWEILWS